MESENSRPVRDKFLPSPYVEMVFINKGGAYLVHEEDRFEALPASGVFGLQQQSLNVRVQGSFSALGVKFRPEGFYQLMQIQMSTLANRVVSLRKLIGEKSQDITEQLLNTSSPYRQLEAIELFLLDELASRPRPEHLPYLQRAIRKVMETGGNVTVTELADAAAVSERQMERKFMERIGLSPKKFIRNVRITQVFKLLKQKPNYDWLDVIYRCNYFDQAHFTRDFKALTGETPTTYFSRRSFLRSAFQERAVRA